MLLLTVEKSDVIVDSRIFIVNHLCELMALRILFINLYKKEIL